MERLIVKVCGMRQADNIREVEALGIDWMGFIFFPKSSRFVDRVPSYLPRNAKRVGVFVNEAPEKILQRVLEYRLDIVQLHGKESPELMARLRKDLPAGTLLIKAFNVADKDDLQATLPYQGVSDYFLFDTKAPLAGGNGIKFNWDLLADYDGSTPFLLSGGIGPEDAGAVRNFRHPKLAGVDLNSRFEITPALKDPSLIRHFMDQLSNK